MSNNLYSVLASKDSDDDSTNSAKSVDAPHLKEAQQQDVPNQDNRNEAGKLVQIVNGVHWQGLVTNQLYNEGFWSGYDRGYNQGYSDGKHGDSEAYAIERMQTEVGISPTRRRSSIHTSAPATREFDYLTYPLCKNEVEHAREDNDVQQSPVTSSIKILVTKDTGITEEL